MRQRSWSSVRLAYPNTRRNVGRTAHSVPVLCSVQPDRVVGMVNRWEDLEYCPESGVLRNARRGVDLGANSGNGYLQVSIEGTIHGVHRVAWFLYHGEWPKHEIDHINRMRSDNRISNLRDVTRFENQQNKPLGEVPVKGVYRKRGRYAVQQWVDGKKKYYGTYETLEEAAAKAAEVQYEVQ